MNMPFCHEVPNDFCFEASSSCFRPIVRFLFYKCIKIYREDLLAASMVSSTGEEGSPLFVALYDFHGVGEEQLSIRKGDTVGYLTGRPSKYLGSRSRLQQSWRVV